MGDPDLSTTQRYSTVAIVLHWLIALALAGELALGFTMPRDASGFELFQLHKSIGITILVLSLARLGWRLTHRPPPSLEGGWEGWLAKAVHVLFYVVMIGTPLAGWAIVSSASIDVPTVLFGVIPLPHLPLGEGVNDLAAESHEIMAKVGIGLFFLHVIGALRHQFMLKDGLLARMSFDKGHMALGLLAAVVLVWAAVFFGIGGSGDDDHDHATDHAEGVADDHGSGAEVAGDAAIADNSSDGELADDGHNHVHADEDATEAEVAAAEPEQAGPPPSWAIQPGGTLRFSVSNSGTAINGSFGSWSGDIAMDPDAPESAAITIRVNLASASLGDATQDGMLQGSDFFNTSANPQATWRSTSVRRVSGNRYEADGTLSLRGASRPQRIAFTLGGSGNRRSVEGSATVDRNAFGVGTGESAAGLAGNVTVNFAFDATRR